MKQIKLMLIAILLTVVVSCKQKTTNKEKYKYIQFRIKDTSSKTGNPITMSPQETIYLHDTTYNNDTALVTVYRYVPPKIDTVNSK